MWKQGGGAAWKTGYFSNSPWYTHKSASLMRTLKPSMSRMRCSLVMQLLQSMLMQPACLTPSQNALGRSNGHPRGGLAYHLVAVQTYVWLC